jgi:hypothetical protein
MSSKYSDMVALLEWATRQKEPKKPRLSRKKNVEDLRIEDLDLAEVYLKLDAREKKIKASKEAIEKMMKKEEKKPEPGMKIERIAMILVATFPITGPLYYMWLTKTLGLH